MSWRDGGHRVAGAAIPFKQKGVEGSCGVFLKCVVSYEGSVRYVVEFIVKWIAVVRAACCWRERKNSCESCCPRPAKLYYEQAE